jgi:DNA-binding transcriptional ArsR family regulator
MSQRPTRHVTDARVLAALTHPLRSQLLEILQLDGPATASVLAERTGQAVGNISHHLKVLAACDLIVEAPELAKDRRERWWRRAPSSFRWDNQDFHRDPAGAAIAYAASSMNIERHADRARTWLAASEDRREQWADAPFSIDGWARLTPAELAEVSREVLAVFQRWGNRELPDDGAERETVFLFAHGVPAQP